jgi:NAD(P)-dependent dehydrogenase (short-subunit alcohol dehydrogenase family)
MRPLANESVIVTGAGRGIGRAIALRLASDGARVTLTARSAREIGDVGSQIVSRGGEALTVVADVTNPTAVSDLIAIAARRFGEVSVVVSNAGVPGPFGPVGDVEPSTWWDSQKVHVLAPLLLMRATIPAMRARRRGRIITVVSSAGLQPIPHLSAYAVGKSTLLRLTETVDMEEREHGIRAFALHPGLIVTKMARETMSSPAAQRWLPELVGRLRSRHSDASESDQRRCADVVAAIAAGHYDALGGRYLSAEWDLEARALNAGRHLPSPSAI